MIDDSIVRGTTSDRIVGMLQEAGAKEVHVRISSPPFLYPCYFGTDIPDREQLIAYNRSVDEICRIIGADSLAYLRKRDWQSFPADVSIVMAAFQESIQWRLQRRISGENMRILNVEKIPM